MRFDMLVDNLREDVKKGKPNKQDRLVWMHQIIIKTQSGFDTDHIDGNGVNNTRNNLRIVTHRENGQNRHSHRTSRFVGVYWNAQRNKWQAGLKINGKTQYLGRYSDEETAGLVYQDGARKPLSLGRG